MDVCIVSIGTELLLGQITDTNARLLAERLASAGHTSRLRVTVGDNHAQIVWALAEGLARADAVITTGGLGPTQDDITREAVAAVAGVPLERDERVAARIEAIFRDRGRPMPENNYRQALVPRGAQVIEQRKGTAPGLVVPVGSKLIACVPGVPYEAEDMVDEVLAAFAAHDPSPGVLASRVLRTWGLGESRLAELVAPRFDALWGTPTTLAFLASGIEGIKVRITTRGSDPDGVKATLDAEERTLRAILGDYVFGVDDDSLERVVARAVTGRQARVAVAESLTGGMLASRLVAVPGASAWFRGGVVAYDPALKHEVLGVRAKRVVSEAAAVEMALGAARVLGADIGVATTGVAGPDSLEGEPPGTVWIGVAIGQRAAARQVRLLGDRERVRTYAVASALDLVRLTLEGSPRGLSLEEHSA